MPKYDIVKRCIGCKYESVEGDDGEPCCYCIGFNLYTEAQNDE